jgi:hypothetical protein
MNHSTQDYGSSSSFFLLESIAGTDPVAQKKALIKMAQNILDLHERYEEASQSPKNIQNNAKKEKTL